MADHEVSALTPKCSGTAEGRQRRSAWEKRTLAGCGHLHCTAGVVANPVKLAFIFLHIHREKLLAE